MQHAPTSNNDLGITHFQSAMLPAKQKPKLSAYHCMTPTSRSQQPSRGTQIDRIHPVLVTLKHTQHLCRTSVPELNFAVDGTFARRAKQQ